MWPCIVTCDRASWKILTIKPTRCTNFLKFYFGMKLHVSEVPVHHQEFLTVHSATVYVIQTAFEQQQDQDRTAVPSWSCCCVEAVYKPVWHIPLCVRWETPDDGQRNCPKHVEFHSKIKADKIGVSSWFYCKEIIWHSMQETHITSQTLHTVSLITRQSITLQLVSYKDPAMLAINRR
jgi:hypothetical protein